MFFHITHPVLTLLYGKQCFPVSWWYTQEEFGNPDNGEEILKCPEHKG